MLSREFARAAATFTAGARHRPTEVWRPRIPTDSVGRSGLVRRQPPRKAVTGPPRCHFLLIFQVLELIITKNRLRRFDTRGTGRSGIVD